MGYVEGDFLIVGFTPQVGTTLEHLTGGVRLGYSNYVLAPRTLADIEP